MHLLAWMSAMLLLAGLAAFAAEACAGVEIVELTAPEPAGPPVPWVAPDDEAWQAGESRFTLGDGDADVSAAGWLAVSDEAILLHVRVRDDVHRNDKTGGNIWDGDALQIGIDARGDGAGTMDPDTRATFGPDDMALSVALAADGPTGWVHFAGNADARGALPAECVSVERDEDAGLTVYTLRLPWALLGTQPGLAPTLGLAVQVNDTDPQDDAQARLHFGAGADGHPRPGRFERLVLADPPGPRAGLRTGENVLWDAADSAEVWVMVSAEGPRTLRASLGEESAERAIPADGQVRRFVVRGRPGSLAEGVDARLAVAVEDPSGATAVGADLALVVPEAVYASLVQRLTERAASAEHPLLARHLQSVKGVVQAEWARLTLYRAADPLKAGATLANLQALHEGLDTNAGQWDTYLNGQRELVLAFLSRRDGTLQHYILGLPRDWDPQKAYPLFVELHGAGNPNPLNNVAAFAGHAQGQTPELAGYTAPITYAGLQRNGYHIMPFGRGNSGYRDIGETDVWEALADFDRHFRADPDRRYLYGFSMGGGGTWALGSRTPDRWAAIAMFAPAYRRVAGDEDNARNVLNLPVWLWCGEEDRFITTTRWIRDQITRVGGEPVFSSTPDLGHNYLGDKQVEATNWLQQHTRRRPARFQFVADTNEHTGVWGITMRRDVSLSGRPSFTARVEGNTLHLDTEGTASVELALGEGGLGLEGDVTVILNGQPAYQGPAKTVTLEVQPR